MDDQQLKRSLQSIGKECFVKYFTQFSDATISTEDLVELLVKNENWKESGCKTRIAQSRRVIRQQRAKDALNIIIASKALRNSVIIRARELVSKI